MNPYQRNTEAAGSIDNFPPQGKGTPQSTDVRLSPRTIKMIEQYNTLNSGFHQHHTPLSGSKVILVGDPQVGKTSLFVRISKNLFEAVYRPTIGLDFQVKKYSVFGIPFNLTIWDTAGQERFRTLTKTYHRGANACICAFDLNQSSSLKNAKMWVNEVRQHCEMPNLKVFLVGTKSDLYHDVTTHEAERVAREIGAEYFEVSAKNNVNVTQLFDRVTFLTFEQELLKWYSSHESRRGIGNAFDANDNIVKSIDGGNDSSNNNGSSTGSGSCSMCSSASKR